MSTLDSGTVHSRCPLSVVVYSSWLLSWLVHCFIVRGVDRVWAIMVHAIVVVQVIVGDVCVGDVEVSVVLHVYVLGLVGWCLSIKAIWCGNGLSVTMLPINHIHLVINIRIIHYLPVSAILIKQSLSMYLLIAHYRQLPPTLLPIPHLW